MRRNPADDPSAVRGQPAENPYRRPPPEPSPRPPVQGAPQRQGQGQGQEAQGGPYGTPAGGGYQQPQGGWGQPPGAQHQQPQGGYQGQPGQGYQPQQGGGGQRGYQGPPQPSPREAPPQGFQPPGTRMATGQPGSARVRLTPVSVEEIVETDVVTAQRDTPIATVAAKMAEEDVGSVVIVDGDAPAGIVTDRQIALALETTPDVSTRTANDLLTEDLVTGTLDMSVFDALTRLSDEGIRRLPLVDDGGALRGIVTLDDIIVLLGAELSKATEIIRAQSTRL